MRSHGLKKQRQQEALPSTSACHQDGEVSNARQILTEQLTGKYPDSDQAWSARATLNELQAPQHDDSSEGLLSTLLLVLAGRQSA